LGIRSAAVHSEGFTAILRKSLTVNADDMILEKPSKLALFRLA